MESNKEFLGTEPIGKLLFRLSIPTVVAQLINMLYNIVDRIYIGHIPEIGGAALTGVGLFTPILMLITAFAMMMGSGGAIVGTYEDDAQFQRLSSALETIGCKTIKPIIASNEP